MVTAAGEAFGSVHLIACSSCHQLPVPHKEAMGRTGAQPAARHYVFLLLSPELRALNLRKKSMNILLSYAGKIMEKELNCHQILFIVRYGSMRF